MYKERFPNDIVIIADAHQYLLDHYKDFDFIWSSPPCPSHSKARFWGSKGGQVPPIYPEMSLYQEIIFLQHFSLTRQKWVVENVNGYYEPLIKAQKRGRHLYWSNFTLPSVLSDRFDVATKRDSNELKNLCKFHEIEISEYKGSQNKTKIARNLVDFEAGLKIFNTARNIIEKSSSKQIELF
jgi:DNA (cytosine-5)-methyltransferase 1